MSKTVLTGIKPTGTPHIGNYLGAIRPALDLSDSHDALYFIADYHALTTVKDAALLRHQTYQVAATWLALGLDPEKTLFYRQSDIPEIYELQWILSCFASKGLLNRAHAYKGFVDENVKHQRDTDHGINMGLFTYPILMAADILIFDTHLVPVGQDQKQHVEIARDIAEQINALHPELLTLPEPLIPENVKSVPVRMGRK